MSATRDAAERFITRVAVISDESAEMPETEQVSVAVRSVLVDALDDLIEDVIEIAEESIRDNNRQIVRTARALPT